jgi:4-amino-4-deoxy-L-arabinose transferase-like glycosyltransferase
VLGVLLVSLLAHALLLAEPLPILLRAAAALLITTVLPGLLLAALLAGPGRGAEFHLTRAVLGLAAGYAVCIAVMLVLGYFPGGIGRGWALAAFDAVTVLLVISYWVLEIRDWRLGWAESSVVDNRPLIQSVEAPNPHSPISNLQSLIYSLPFWTVVVLLLAALLRLPHLGYAEFQGDEARVMLRASDALAGYENALLIHHKAPGELLISAAPLLLVGATTEAAARLPFTVANLAGLVGVLLLGWRMIGPVAGVAAALLLTVDGYLVAFGRIVQYQSVVFLASVAALLALYAIYADARQDSATPGREGSAAIPTRSVGTSSGLRLAPRLALAAVIAAGGLLAHYEIAGIALPTLYLLALIARRVGPSRLLRALWPGALIGLALAALFFIPYLRYPGFGAAVDYVLLDRLGDAPPYNNLRDFFTRSALYSSSYYLFFLIAVTIAYATACYVRTLGRKAGLLGGGLLAVLILFLFARPEWAQPDRDAAWFFFVLAFVPLWLIPGLRAEERLLWLWFGSLLLLALFFVARPASHVYTFVIPWALVVGAALHALVAWAKAQGSPREFAWAGGIAAALLLAIFAFYPWRLFADAPRETLRTWAENRPRAYWFPFDRPPDQAIFGFPLRNGWKAVGAGYAAGLLDGQFESNAKPEIADWYTRALPACPQPDRYWLLADTVESGDDEQIAHLAEEVQGQGYTLAGRVAAGGANRLSIYSHDGEPGQSIDLPPLEEIEPVFDRTLSGLPLLGRRGRVLHPQSDHALDLRLGDGVRLIGYNMDRNAAVPDETVTVTLFWEALTPLPRSYTVFVQLVDLATNAKAAQRDALPVCGRALTHLWNPGDLIADPHPIRLNDDAAPGTYMLFVGLYDVETGERLPVTDAAGTPIGDAVPLAQIEVSGEP